MFPFMEVVLLGMVVLVLIMPFLRSRASSQTVSVGTSKGSDLTAEKETLVGTLYDLEIDHARGLVTLEDYERLKGEYEHRLVAVLHRLDEVGPNVSVRVAVPARSIGREQALWVRVWTPFALGALVVGGIILVQSLVEWRISERQLAKAADRTDAPGTPPINPVEMVKRLEKRLKENPDDLQGQIMAGRSYAVLERWDEAKAAWRKVIELDKTNYLAYYGLGEILVRTSHPSDTAAFEEALELFDKALIPLPQDPTILWARGVALVQLRRFPEAYEAWTEAYKGIPPDTDSAKMVKEALQALRAGKLSGASAETAPGTS